MVQTATGVTFEPTRIKRKAEAEAKALLITTTAEIEAQELRKCAAQRFIAQELKKQENLESVLLKAAPQLAERFQETKEVDPDWITRFILEAQEVSDSGLQDLWANILAGEVKSPGTYSRRVLRIVKDLDLQDARLIAAVGSYVMRVEDYDGTIADLLISRIEQQWNGPGNTEPNEIFEKHVDGVDQLRDLGVILSDECCWELSVEGGGADMHLSSFSAKRLCSDRTSIIPSYAQPAFVKREGPPVKNGQLVLNVWTKRIRIYGYRITSAGVQLFKLAGSESNPKFLDEIRSALVEKAQLLVEL